MTLSIIVRLRHGKYDAGDPVRGQGEWPPHPARVFCALTASAAGRECTTLRWLEAQSAPQIWADPAALVHYGSRAGYVVTNATAQKGGSVAWPGRQSRLTKRAFAVPATGSFALVWPDADPTATTLAELQDLARLIPYVGRSTSLAEVHVTDVVPDLAPGQAVYRAAAPGHSRDTFQVRVAYPGYSDELEAAYQDGRQAWEAGRSVTYTTAVPDEPGGEGRAAKQVARGPFSPLMVWSLERPGPRIDGEMIPAVAAALRSAVMSRVEEPVPTQVSGHGAQGLPHVGFLPLPDVGHDHADGHVLGVALAVPRDLPGDDLARLLQGVLVNPITRVRVRGRALAVRYGANRVSLRPERWSRSSSEWCTVTPLMLDGYLRHGRDEAREVARSLEIAGYPRPADVVVSPSPLTSGAIWRPHPSALPAGRPHRRLVHARVTFSEPIEGPVLAGAMRYLGLGLFLPAPAARTRSGRAPATIRTGSRKGQPDKLEAAP